MALPVRRHTYRIERVLGFMVTQYRYFQYECKIVPAQLFSLPPSVCLEQSKTRRKLLHIGETSYPDIMSKQGRCLGAFTSQISVLPLNTSAGFDYSSHSHIQPVIFLSRTQSLQLVCKHGEDGNFRRLAGRARARDLQIRRAGPDEVQRVVRE